MAWTNSSPVEGTLGLVGLSERPRALARVQCCVLIITCIVSTDSIITTPPLPYIRHSLSFVLTSWPPTYESDRQTDFAHFLIRGASYTLIPKPYLEMLR